MTKHFGLSVVAATLLATGASAATVSAPNNNLSAWGVVSASLTQQSENIQGNSETTDNDYFCLDSAVLGISVKADENNKFGGTMAIGNFALKTVTGAKVAVKDPVTGESNFRTWLGHIDYIPVSDLTVNAGLLWQNFGEKPVDSLNPHMTRTTDYVFQPVAMAGLRLNYDAGIAKVYAGLNDGSVLGGSHKGVKLDITNSGSTQKGAVNVVATSMTDLTDGKETGVLGNDVTDSTSGMELGATIALDPVDIGLNYFVQGGDALNTINASVTEKVTGYGIGFTYNTHASKLAVTEETALAIVGGHEFFDDEAAVAAAYTATENSAVAGEVYVYDMGVNSMALNANVKISDAIEIPVRYDTTTITLDEPNAALAMANDWTISALTITPTYHPTAASFVRAEIVMASASEKLFADSDGKDTASRQTMGLEFGVFF